MTLGDKIENSDAGNNHRDSNEMQKGECFAKVKDSNDHNTNNSETGPDGIDNAYRKSFESDSHQPKSEAVACAYNERWIELGKTMRYFQCACGNNFSNDCEKKKKIGVHIASFFK